MVLKAKEYLGASDFIVKANQDLLQVESLNTDYTKKRDGFFLQSHLS